MGRFSYPEQAPRTMSCPFRANGHSGPLHARPGARPRAPLCPGRAESDGSEDDGPCDTEGSGRTGASWTCRRDQIKRVMFFESGFELDGQHGLATIKRLNAGPPRVEPGNRATIQENDFIYVWAKAPTACAASIIRESRLGFHDEISKAEGRCRCD